MSGFVAGERVLCRGYRVNGAGKPGVVARVCRASRYSEDPGGILCVFVVADGDEHRGHTPELQMPYKPEWLERLGLVRR